MKISFFIRVVVAVLILQERDILSQTKETDSLTHTKDKAKKGLNFGALPALSFDSDLGLQYGIIGTIYNYGNGNIYPRYTHSLYLEWSRTTKGNGENRITYDSEYLIPKMRVSAEAYYLTDQSLHFYGFNGSGALYNSSYETLGSSSYISRMFYRLNRKALRLSLDVQGSVIQRKLRWLAGYTYLNHKITRLNFNQINKGKSPSDLLKDTTTLYDKYLELGLIPYDEKDGGITNLIKAGIVFDTRDNEPNPMQGIWSEALIIIAPAFLSNNFSFAKLAITHRQYFTLRKEVINLAYRISYQDKIFGKIPFYMLPYIYNSNNIREGLGGAKTLRGILRNRIVGEDLFYGNIEIRWKILRLTRFNQNFYFAVAGFTDFGIITGNYPVKINNQEVLQFQKQSSFDSFHQSYGLGLYGAMNQNFVAAINYGVAANKRDGQNGLYVGLDFLF